ncbi:hypothetical protein [Propylenella binzhouense]|nr:hypothetical protein [Propylenella binzhouense]
MKLRAGEHLHRFHAARREPIFFDTTTTGRFNAPDASYGVRRTIRTR